MRLEAEVDQRSLRTVQGQVLRAIHQAEYEALKVVTRAFEKDIEGQTRGASRGNAWRAWKSAVYPHRDAPEMDAQGRVFANGGARSKGLLVYWSLAGVNRPKTGRYLAVPMNDAAQMLRARRGVRGARSGVGDVQKFQLWTGLKLSPLFRPGKTPLLIAKGYRTAGGAFMQKSDDAAAAMRRGGQRLEPVAIPMFALIDTQPHANRVGLAAAKMRAMDKFGPVFSRRLKVNL